MKKQIKFSSQSEFNKVWDALVDLDIANDEELKLVTAINGRTVETLNDVIYVRTGYRNIEQLDEAYGYGPEDY